MPRSLVDTNILVYAQDRNEPVKRAAAIELIDRLTSANEFVVSVQCLNEFSSVGLRRGLSIAAVRAAVETWSALADVLPITKTATTQALTAVERHGLAFWDVLIWATAHEGDRAGDVFQET
jgi:predicted nucleic acid-binding protein